MDNDCASKSRPEIMRQHRPPGIPVMWPFLSPDIQLVPDTFIVQHFGEFPAGIRVFVGSATGKDMDVLALPDLFKNSMVTEVLHIMPGTVEIHIIIKITLCVF